jgi:Conjugative transposon protein TcpC
MVRRTTLDRRGPQSDVHAGGSELPPPGQARGAPDRSPATWRGAGGRWAVWIMRVLVWAVLLIIGVRGVIAIALNQKTPSGSTATIAGKAGPARSFPAGVAEAYALQFASVYLNVNQSTAGQRAQQLAGFLPGGSDPQLGWNRAGSLSLQSAQVAGIDVRDRQHAVVTVLARVNDRLMELGVPVYAAGGGMVVSGQPAWLPAPAQISPPAPVSQNSDPTGTAALQAQLPAFFQAYASGDSATIARFLAPGAAVTGLGGAVTYSSIATLYVPAGGDTRQITVSVVWQIPAQKGAAPVQLPMTYDMTVVSQNANWYVKSVRASAQPIGQQS